MTRTEDPFGLWSNPFLAAGLAAVWIVLLAIFHALPQWDLAAAAAFFDPAACAATQNGRFCAGFPVAQSELANAVRDTLHRTPIIIGIVLLVPIVLDIRRGLRWRDAPLRVKTVLVGALILGPGLLVNGILKEFWGRPRPWMTEEFGGWMPFVEAGVMEGMCQSNCSFVSGEGAGGGWLVCLTVLFPPRWRRIAFVVLLVIGGGMAFLRVAFGAHYLSDALLGFLSSITLFVMLAALAQWSTGSAQQST